MRAKKKSFIPHIIRIVFLILIILAAGAFFVLRQTGEEGPKPKADIVRSDSWLFEEAVETGDFAYCMQISDEQLKQACFLHDQDPCLLVRIEEGEEKSQECYSNMAIEKTDLIFCDRINGSTDTGKERRNMCKRQVMDKIIENGDASLCKGRSSCVKYLAFYTNDVTYCESQPLSQISPQCVSPEDEETKKACEKMKLEMIKDCKLHFPGQPNIICSEKKASDPDFYKTSTEEDTDADNIIKNNCILLDAAATLNPMLCDFIICEDEGEICFEKTACEAVIAIKSKDINKCNDLEGRDSALFRAICQNDASQCSSLKDEWRRLFCTALVNSNPKECSKTLSMSKEVECKIMYDFMSPLLK
jgi:hypothetical protein